MSHGGKSYFLAYTGIDNSDLRVQSLRCYTYLFTYLVIGCMSELSVNGDRLPMSAGSTDKFDVTVTGSDSVSRGCDGCPVVSVCGVGLTCSSLSGGKSTQVSCLNTPSLRFPIAATGSKAMNFDLNFVFLHVHAKSLIYFFTIKTIFFIRNHE